MPKHALTGPRGLTPAQLLDHHRLMFGTARMMADDGGDQGGGDQGGGDQGGGDQGGGDAGQDDPAPKPGPPAKADDDTNPWADPDKAKAEIERLRGENAKTRTNAKAAAADEARKQLTQDLAKALGLTTGDDKAPTPDELAQQVAASQAAQREAAVELALYKAAGQHQADPAKLLDSRSFMDSVKDLDPTDTDAVAAAIKAAVEKNTSLKARAAGASGADHAGGSGETKARTPRSLTDAATAYYGT